MSILIQFFSCIDQSLIDDLVPFVVFRKARHDEVEMIMHNTSALSSSAPNIHVTPHSSHTPDNEDYYDYETEVSTSDNPLSNLDDDTAKESTKISTIKSVETDTPISRSTVQNSPTTAFATYSTMLHTTQQSTPPVTSADSERDVQSWTNMTSLSLGEVFTQPSSVVPTSLYDLLSPMSASVIATTLPFSPQSVTYLTTSLTQPATLTVHSSKLPETSLVTSSLEASVLSSKSSVTLTQSTRPKSSIAPSHLEHTENTFVSINSVLSTPYLDFDNMIQTSSTEPTEYSHQHSKTAYVVYSIYSLNPSSTFSTDLQITSINPTLSSSSYLHMVTPPASFSSFLSSSTSSVILIPSPSLPDKHMTSSTIPNVDVDTLSQADDQEEEIKNTGSTTLRPNVVNTEKGIHVKANTTKIDSRESKWMDEVIKGMFAKEIIHIFNQCQYIHLYIF